MKNSYSNCLVRFALLKEKKEIILKYYFLYRNGYLRKWNIWGTNSLNDIKNIKIKRVPFGGFCKGLKWIWIK